MSLAIAAVVARISRPLLYQHFNTGNILLLSSAGGALAVFLIQALYFENIPHVTDAVSQWFQSCVLASGRLAAPVPPCWKAFAYDNLIMTPDGKWFTKYFPGHSLWLALFRLLRIPWAAGPVAAAAVVAATATLARRHGPRASALAALLAGTSPLLLLLGASFMSHMTATMWLALSFAFLANADRLTILRCAGSGLCAGMAFITRPQDAAGVYAVTGVATLCLIFRSQSSFPVTRIVTWVVAAAPPLLFLLIWNQALYGQPIATGYNLFGRGISSLTPVISDTLGISSSFTLEEAAQQAIWTTLRFNKALFGWPTSLFFIPFALLVRPSSRTWTITSAGLAIWLLYFFFPYYGFEYEARYFAPIAPIGVLLTVEGARRFYELTRKIYTSQKLTQKADLQARQLTAAIVVAGIIYSWLYYWPIYIFPRYANDYESVGGSIHRICSSNVSERALILLPAMGEDHFRYGSGLVFTDPFLRSRLIYARDLPEVLPCIRENFHDRAVYRFLPENNWQDGTLVRLRDPLS